MSDKKKYRITLLSFVAEFLEYSEGVYRPKTIATYRSAFNEFIRHVGEKRLIDISVRDAEMFISHKINSVSHHTARRCYLHLSSAFGTAVRWEYLSKNIWRSVTKPRVPETVPAHFNRKELSKLLEHIPNPEFRDLVLFAVMTGARMGEIISLRWRNIELEAKLIHIRNSDEFVTKSKKSRTVPVSDSLYNILICRNRATDEYVFTTKKGEPFKQNYVSKKFKSFVRAAGLDDRLRFHSLRHTTATLMIKSGIPIFDVCKVLGHCSTQVTEKYIHIVSGELHSAVNVIFPIENNPIDNTVLTNNKINQRVGAYGT